jgi:hypothetical protein
MFDALDRNMKPEPKARRAKPKPPRPQAQRKTSTTLAPISHERIVEVIRRVRAMRFVRNFFPLVFIEFRERGVAVEVGGNFGDDQLVA